jgi:hypothetical protein
MIHFFPYKDFNIRLYEECDKDFLYVFGEGKFRKKLKEPQTYFIFKESSIERFRELDNKYKLFGWFILKSNVKE